MPEPLLQLQIAKSYPEFNLQAELTIYRNEFLALVGPSGCGKTTLMRLITGLEQPDAGFIRLNGTDITKLPPAQRRIGMVFQDYALFPHLSVYQNIEYGLKVQRLPQQQRKQIIGALLELFRLNELRQRKIDQLSGGEKQRVALARSLAPRPSLLLLDEPFSSLDYLLRQQLQQELRDWQQQLGATFIFVTHQQDEALSLSDRLAVMKDGRVLQTGTPRVIYEHPANDFVANFFGEANLLPVRLELAAGPDLTLHFDEPLFANLRITASQLSPELKPGRYFLVVRPEEFVFRPEPAAGCEAAITALNYLGFAVRLELRVGQTTIRALVSKEQSELTAGMSVRFGLRDGKLRLIARENRVGGKR